MALHKGFVFDEWFGEAVSIFHNPKVACLEVVNFACSLGLAFRDEIWLVQAKHCVYMEKHRLILLDGSSLTSVSGLTSRLSAGVVDLLGIDEAFETNPFVIDLAAPISGTGAKKRLTRVPTSGLVGSGSSHKIKKPLSGTKLSSNGATLNDNGSGQVVEQFNSINTDGKASESEGISDSKMNTPQAKCFNNGAIIGSLLDFINYDMEEEEEIFLLSCKSFSLDKACIDPKIIKTQVEVAVKKFFTLDINFLAIEGKLATAKTQVIRKLFSGINDFGGATIPSKFEGII
ncbi:hypothetical protein G9A89_023591 [Geosiphon pyriformis]|nr:hypothetical protein G9A89_023591 [Geosiphon pyriformis]